MCSNARPTDDYTSSDPEIGRLRERLAFYETFNRLIHENISQASSLLREAIDLREGAERDVSSARERLEEERTREREEYRALFSEMLDEITALQGRAERIARQLADALDRIEEELPAGAPFPPLPGPLPTDLDALAGSTQPEDEFPETFQPDEIDPDILTAEERPAAIGSGNAQPAPESSGPNQTMSASPENNQDIALPVFETSTAEEAPGDLASEALATEPDVAETAEPQPGSGSRHNSEPMPTIDARSGSGAGPIETYTLLLHGVPRAATALSLKRYLEQLDAVHTVEPREFAAGLLRMQLTVERDLVADDFRGWAEAQSVSTVHARPGFLELQL
jgi:hypothetical protein